METDKKKVKESLDKLVLEFFDILQSLYQQQASLERVMRDGYLSLSRARYSMGGTRNVGALQFAENELELNPLVEVNVDSTSAADTEKEADADAPLTFDMKIVDKRTNVSGQTECEKDTQKDEVRRRNVKKTDTHTESSKTDTVETVGRQKETRDKREESKSVDRSGLKDPIRLFGVLVSPHLRQSQASFRQAVETTIEIANLKRKLCNLRKQYLNLMSQKKALETS